uniref:DUF4592 domain-containing protein n=1 Tax=Latimeria chalumnae TaxID=7897 RepID=H2ZVI7_LATCH
VGKKKSKFKSLKKFFVKKKRKEPSSSSSSSSVAKSGLKQSQSTSDVTTPESLRVDYDSEDEVRCHTGIIGTRALSHDSIFITEAAQDPPRPVRVLSQESVSGRIKALQLKVQQNIKLGPPPLVVPTKKLDDAGASSEDDGLPRSPPEVSLLQEAMARTLVTKTKLIIPHSSFAWICKKNNNSSVSPAVDFDSPPQVSACLDSSAAKHKLSLKPRNQRSGTKGRRPLSNISRVHTENLSDVNCTLEENVEEEEKETSKDVFADDFILKFSLPQPAPQQDKESGSFLEKCLSKKSSAAVPAPVNAELTKTELESKCTPPVTDSVDTSPDEKQNFTKLNAHEETGTDKPAKIATKPRLFFSKGESQVVSTSSEEDVRLPNAASSDNTLSKQDVWSDCQSSLDGAEGKDAAIGELKGTLDSSENERALERAPKESIPQTTTVVTKSDDPTDASKERAETEEKCCFGVKLRSTSLSIKYRENPCSDIKTIKRYSAEINLVRDETAETKPSSDASLGSSFKDSVKMKARSSEQLNVKPPLARKPVLQT